MCLFCIETKMYVSACMDKTYTWFILKVKKKNPNLAISASSKPLEAVSVVLTCLHSNMVWMKNWQHLLLKSKVISLTMGYWGIPTRLLFNRVWRIQVGRQCIRSAPLALMDVNHARGQRLFSRLEVHSVHSVIICSWCALKKRLYAFSPHPRAR